MKVLLIGNDSHVFDAGSKVRARVESYATYVENLVMLSPGKNTSVIKIKNLTLYSFAESRVWYLFRLPSRIRKLVREEGIDVVSAQDPFEFGLATILGTRGTRARTHLQLHTDPFAKGFVSVTTLGLLNLVRKALLSFTILRADGVRVVSTRLQNEIKRRWRVPVSVIPVMVQEQPFTHKTHSKEANSFVTIGRLTPEKNLRDIIFAFSRLLLSFPDASLTIVGDGPELESLRKTVRKLQIQNKVEFLAHVPHVLEILMQKHVYVHASSYEGYGLTLIEAALGELPIITTDVGVVGDVLVHNESALVYRPHDIDSLCAHMKALLENPERQIILGQEGAKRVREHLAQYANVPEMVVRDLKACIKSSS